MKKTIIFVAITFGTPALAHHEVAATGSLLPLAIGLAVMTAGGLTAWRQKRKKKIAQSKVPARTGRFLGAIFAGK